MLAIDTECRDANAIHQGPWLRPYKAGPRGRWTTERTWFPRPGEGL